MVNYINRELEKHNFTLEFKHKSFIIDRIGKNRIVRCRAYFDESNKIIVVSTKSNIETHILLAHEFSHFMQYIKKTKFYKTSDLGYNKIYKYLSTKKKMKENELKKYLIYCIQYEMEAEKMALKILKKFKVKINEKQYIKESNFYLYGWGKIFHDKYHNDITQKELPKKIPTYFLKPEDYIKDSIKFL